VLPTLLQAKRNPRIARRPNVQVSGYSTATKRAHYKTEQEEMKLISRIWAEESAITGS
jgi:alpha-D-ribose 1-methylphosphonate 5-triphosphate synthase subunit PhnI